MSSKISSWSGVVHSQQLSAARLPEAAEKRSFYALRFAARKHAARRGVFMLTKAYGTTGRG
jgi:hypothetical protein